MRKARPSGDAMAGQPAPVAGGGRLGGRRSRQNAPPRRAVGLVPFTWLRASLGLP